MPLVLQIQPQKMPLTLRMLDFHYSELPALPAHWISAVSLCWSIQVGVVTLNEACKMLLSQKEGLASMLHNLHIQFELQNGIVLWDPIRFSVIALPLFISNTHFNVETTTGASKLPHSFWSFQMSLSVQDSESDSARFKIQPRPCSHFGKAGFQFRI